MASSYKVLGQVTPSANADTNLYAVPASTQAVISTLNICNQNNVPITFRIAIRPAGATLSALHYIAYDTVVPAYDSLPITIGITLATTDVVTIRASATNVSFSAFGSEVT